MAVITTVTHVCDRCESEHDPAKYMSGQSWAQMNLSWNGDKGGRMMDGGPGGYSISGKAWLCAMCVEDFEHFMKTRFF